MEWLTVDVTTPVLVVTFVAFGVLRPSGAFSDFTNDIVIVLTSVFVPLSVMAGALPRIIDAS